MNKPKWGVKRQCQECGARFYDLKKTKIVCPRCDAPFKVEPQPKAKRAIATPEKAALPQPTAEVLMAQPREAAESDEEKAIKALEVDVPEDEDDEDKDKNAFEDVSELGEDEDDMAEVLEGTVKDEPDT